MSRAVGFQPAWNGFPKRQFHHLERSITRGFTLRAKCVCLECGHEFGVQREGAMYLCERCTAKED